MTTLKEKAKSAMTLLIIAGDTQTIVNCREGDYAH